MKRSSTKTPRVAKAIDRSTNPRAKPFENLPPKTENQKYFVEALGDCKLVVAAGPAGTGKAQPLTSKILTVNGWKQMRDIQVGDLVHSLKGWVPVTGVFPQGNKQVVKLKFKDGAEVECCLDHLWTVYDSIGKEKSTLKTITAREVIDSLQKRKPGRNLSIPASPQIDFRKDNTLPIPPYVLGVLLGDGSITQRTPNVTSIDKEIFSEVLSEMGTSFRFTATESITKYLRTNSRPEHGNPVTAALKGLDLHGKDSYSKFIPTIYKTASVEDRYALLQGLLDTDGTVSRRQGSVTFNSSSAVLANDVREIVISLGGKASISEKIPTYNHNGVKKQGAVHYIVNLNVPDKTRLFRLNRKLELVSKTDMTQLRRVIVGYEFVGEKECQCISVDDPSHLYVTDDFVLTHNTLLSLHHAAKKLYYGKVKRIVLIRAYQPLAGRSIGFLPGELEDKLLPYYKQMLEYLEDFLGKAQVEIHRKKGEIEICSLETIRGRSWDDSVIVIDEAQNLYSEEIQALVTRIGENSQMIFMGDDSGIQTDIKNKQDGLSYLLGIIEKYDIPDTDFIHFDYNDILRSDVTRHFVIAFDKELQEEKAKKKGVSK